MNTSDLSDRIIAANSLSPIVLKDEEISQLVAFLDSLTDPSALNRSEMIPSDLPSGLQPQPRTQIYPTRH
jgi:cytochrome c peroxidase